ncbi:iron-siderophore ABC transporter substrate-binding protein [Brevibacillus nitrificans]|uniref:ABC transporter substrate-binding protein n=1 Tax=Brevibacillus nitrificans TaxID=651560 RepID=UPI002866B49B|nr:iron-siderophore ABC transporter substrate-binding protein [Brevibacillus nitrificans]MDR7314683.1 iron complex transport system substrate-binding protein [Brevibacillus nitrificans]
MIRLQKWSWLLIAMLLAVAVLAGCGGKQQEAAPAQPEQSGQTAQAQTMPAPEPAKEADKQDVRVIKHAMGTTEVKGTPQKVVTLFQGATDTALLLGVKPVGAVESWIEQPWYNYIKDKMDGVTNLGNENQPNMEAIVSLHPDLIIASKTRHEKIYDQLSAIAPTVMTEEVHIWKDTLSLSAEAMNKKAEEAKFLEEWSKKVADFKEKMGDKLKLQVGIVDFRPDHARIVYTGFSALVLDELGISRPMNQKGEEWGVKITSKENISQMDADILFDQTSTTRDDGRMDLRKEWMEHPLWKNLRAVKENRVFAVDTAVWNNGSGPLAALGMVDDLYEFYQLK